MFRSNLYMKVDVLKMDFPKNNYLLIWNHISLAQLISLLTKKKHESQAL